VEALAVRLPFVQVDEAQTQERLDSVVQRTASETLNALLAPRGRSPSRSQALRAQQGPPRNVAKHHTPTLFNKCGEIELRVPKLQLYYWPSVGYS
jgi:hypothetical protein